MTSPRRPGQWRWEAHPPWRPPLEPHRPPPPRHRLGPAWGDRTPAYPATPRWGLPPLVVTPPGRGGPGGPEAPDGRDPSAARRWSGRIADAGPAAAGLARWWLVAAAVVHALRYAVLVFFADRVTPWWLEAGSTVLVWVVGAVAVVVGAAAAVTATAWLVARRREAFAPVGDPRRRIALWAACLLPVVNTVRLPVYLEELRRAAARTPGDPAPSRSRLWRWWAVWTVGGVLVLLAWWRGSVDGPQAAADAVLLSVAAAAVGAWAAHETRTVMRSFCDSSPRFTRRLLVRGIVDASAS